MVQNLDLSRWARLPIRIRFPGIPPEILINYGSLIQEIIKVNKLIPVSKIEAVKTRVMVDAQPIATRSANQTTTAMSLNTGIDWWWKYGGMKVPHLHFGDDAYILNEAQWQTFTTGVMKDVTRKLTKAKNISFDQLVHVADAANEIVG